MLQIAVSRVTTLIGQNMFCTPDYGWRGMFYTIVRPRSVLKAEDALRKTSLYEEFCNVDRVTRKLKCQARELLEQTAREMGVRFASIKHFFAKERGKTQEPTLLDRYNATDRQKVISMKHTTSGNNELEIHGKVDGETKDYIIELKVRSGTFVEFRKCELTQLALYCYIAKRPGLLVVHANGEILEYKMELDEAIEIATEALESLDKFVDLKIAQQSFCMPSH